MKEVYRRRWIVSLNQNLNETAVSVARQVKDGKKRCAVSWRCSENRAEYREVYRDGAWIFASQTVYLWIRKRWLIIALVNNIYKIRSKNYTMATERQIFMQMVLTVIFDNGTWRSLPASLLYTVMTRGLAAWHAVTAYFGGASGAWHRTPRCVCGCRDGR